MPETKAWLVLRSGALAGTRYELQAGVTRVGREPSNDVVIRGPEAATVSLQHLEILNDAEGCRLRDLDSTNGTFVNGERVSECALAAPATIRLGPQGPELAFVVEAFAPALGDTLIVSRDALPPAVPPPAPGDHDALLSEAVARAREARSLGAADQTITIMREALNRALGHTSRRFLRVIAVLLAALLGGAGYGAWKIASLKREKSSVDTRIREIETRLQAAAENPENADRLIAELTSYQTEAEELERSVLYRMALRQPEDFLTAEIRRLLADFGADAYSLPPGFAERVSTYIRQYGGPDRALIAQALGRSAPNLRTMRELLDEEHLPPDLAYMAVVESALAARQTSAAGAAGLWQLTPATARACGLRVDAQVDERLDLRKSTRAACRYLRELILDFGAGSSVMLALAAYNVGPSKVKQAVMRTVRDPIKQRNFWYLYRIRALPQETREYVPKVIAAMVLGRNPQRFGFPAE